MQLELHKEKNFAMSNSMTERKNTRTRKRNSTAVEGPQEIMHAGWVRDTLPSKIWKLKIAHYNKGKLSEDKFLAVVDLQVVYNSHMYRVARMNFLKHNQ